MLFVYEMSLFLIRWLYHNPGLVGYPSDDINKFLWMVRIGGGVFPHIKEPDYLVSFSTKFVHLLLFLNC